MDYAETPPSVAPPGWTPPVAGVAAPVAPAVDVAPRPAYLVPGAGASATAADAALRWRLRAATMDNFIVYGAYLAFCLVVHWKPLTLGHLLVEGLASIGYHFAFESRGGQTPGKRRYGIQVLDADGGPAGPKAIALRSVLRIIDQLPVSYVSGLVSMVRTGPNRRQRIGDVAGNTVVVAVDGRAAAKGTPRWYLPTATIAAVLLSALTAFGVLYARSAPMSSSDQAQFIAGCQAGSPNVDCTCMLHQLQAEGYVSLSSMQTLVQQTDQAMAEGQLSAVPKAMVDAVRVCHT